MSDRKDIAEHQPAPQAIGMPIEQRVSLVQQALTNPEVDPTKAAAMMDLVFRMEDRDREATFIHAKTTAIASMPRIGQDGYNKHLKSHYAKWETMQPIVTKVLAQRGLSLSFEVGDSGNKVTVRPVLQGHGWTEKGDAMTLPYDTGPARSPVQAVGSTISYGKRYAAMAMLNLVQSGVVEDDDGSSAPAERQRTGEQERLVEDGRSAAMQGTAAYEAWFKSIPAAARGWLSMEGEHDRLKLAAERVGQ